MEVGEELKNRRQSFSENCPNNHNHNKDKRLNIRIAAKDLTAPTNAGVRVRSVFLCRMTFHDSDLASSAAFSNALSMWGRWVISGTT